MHIVEIPSFFPPYGGEFCLEQSRALKARGHKVGVVSNVQMSLKLYPFRFFTQSPFRRHVRLYDVDCYLSYQRGIPKVIRLNVERWLRIVQEMFAEYVKENGKPDIIHAHCVKWAGRAAMLISREWGIPYVITEHLPSMIYLREFGEHPQEAWQVPLLREALEQANQVITVSEELLLMKLTMVFIRF